MHKIYSWKEWSLGHYSHIAFFNSKKLRLSALGFSQWVIDGSESIGDLHLPTKVLLSKRFKNKRRHCLQLMYTSCLSWSSGGVSVPLQHCWQIPIIHCFLHHPTSWLIYFPIFPFDIYLSPQGGFWTICNRLNETFTGKKFRRLNFVSLILL